MTTIPLVKDGGQIEATPVYTAGLAARDIAAIVNHLDEPICVGRQYTDKFATWLLGKVEAPPLSPIICVCRYDSLDTR